MIGRADIEGSKSYVAMNAWQPQASSSYLPVGDGTPSLPKESSPRGPLGGSKKPPACPTHPPWLAPAVVGCAGEGSLMPFPPEPRSPISRVNPPPTPAAARVGRWGHGTLVRLRLYLRSSQTTHPPPPPASHFPHPPEGERGEGRGGGGRESTGTRTLPVFVALSPLLTCPEHLGPEGGGGGGAPPPPPPPPGGGGGGGVGGGGGGGWGGGRSPPPPPRTCLLVDWRTLLPADRPR
jgi:hypothetical protein